MQNVRALLLGVKCSCVAATYGLPTAYSACIKVTMGLTKNKKNPGFFPSIEKQQVFSGEYEWLLTCAGAANWQADASTRANVVQRGTAKKMC